MTRIVVTGAAGNVGTSAVGALGEDASARKFRGADAVIHLAWLIQPSRDGAELERVNVHGSRRVFEAAAAAGSNACTAPMSLRRTAPPHQARVARA